MNTIYLECSECGEKFEVSSAIADAMRQWRAESGEPFLCVECATQIEWGEAIRVMEVEHAKNPLEENPLPVGASCARDS